MIGHLDPPSIANRDDRPLAVRTIVRVPRSYRLALALFLAFAAVPAADTLREQQAFSMGALPPNPRAEALADEEQPIGVGTELMATTDVTLHTAEIAKGSRVSVTKLSRTGGQVETVNVALADGHVVKVTMAQVHTFFRVVTE
jgi:prepilin-type processing-associated H-X9-DG protein